MASITATIEAPAIELVHMQGQDPGSGPSEPLRRQGKSVAFKAAFIPLCACSFVSLLDTVIIAAVLPAIAQDLKASSNSAYWCGTGFLFAQAVSQPVYGSLSNTFGRKPSLLFALTLFIVASIFCATAQSITWLIVARVFQDLGGGGNNAMVSVIVTDMVPLNERATYIGFLSIVGAIASVSGSIIGAAIAGRANWRILFWINLPICLPALLGIVYFLHLQLEPGSMRSRSSKLDWIGILVSTGSIAGLLFGITGGSILDPWDSPQILSAIIIGAVGTAIFFLYEAKVSSNPMIPVKIFGNRTSNGAFVASFVMGMVLWAMQYNLVLYFLVSRQHSLLGAAVSMLPGTFTLTFSAVIAAVAIAKTHKCKFLHSIGWALMTVGFSLMTLLSANSNGGTQFGPQVLYGMGGGVVFLCRICAVQASQSDEDVAMSTALLSFITSLGQAFGVGIGGLIFQSEWERIIAIAVSTNLLPKQYVLSSDKAVQVAALIPAFPEEIQILYREIVAKVIDKLFIVLASLSGFALLVSLFANNLSLERDTRSAQPFIERGRRLGEENVSRSDE